MLIFRHLFYAQSSYYIHFLVDFRKLLNSINGVVFPGGSSGNKPGKPYYDSVAQIYKIATEV